MTSALLTRPESRDHIEAAPARARNDVTSWGLGLIGIALCIVAIRVIDFDDIDGLGLFRAVPIWFYVGVGLLASGAIANLLRSSRRSFALAWMHVTALVVMLHGLPGFVEPNPRFPVAWLHLGFSGHIADQGELLPLVDGRFSWPGFFTAAAFLERVAGTDDLTWILRFTPIAINLMAAVVVFELGRALGSGRERATVASIIFVFVNWIGQDYFAPQAIGFLLVLVVITTVLKFFSARPAPGRIANRIVGAESPPMRRFSDRDLTLVYIACGFVAAALIVSHQLSPPILIMSLVLLSAVGRIQVGWLPWLIGLGFLMWLSHGAETFWVGHLDIVTGSGGDVGSVLDQNVSRRAASSASDRQVVLRARIAFILAVWSVAAASLLIERVRGRVDPALVALFVAPFSIIPFQSYGGEVLLRVALFTLPAASIVISRVRVRMDAGAPIRHQGLVAGLVGLSLSLMTPVFMIARYGNESFEQVTDDDLALVAEMYEIVPDGSVVYVRSRITLVSTDRVDAVRFRTLDSDPEDSAEQLRESVEDRPTYVMLTESQERWGQQVKGLEPGWVMAYADDLVAADLADVVARSDDAVLLEVRGSA